jgi:hypothetical protein
MWVMPVVNALVPRGMVDRSSDPKTAASRAPITPIAISHTDARASAVSSLAREAMSKTMLETQAPIGMVTSTGWKGCP